MLKRIFCFVVICSGLGLRAQKLPDYGKVTLEEMQMKECSFDKTAPAMIILDAQTTKVQPDRIVSERRIRIKIFRNEGLRFASVVISYGGNKFSKVNDIAACAYNLDGQNNIVVTKLSKDDIFKDKVAEGFRSIKFAIPNVVPGSVIEYRYDKIEKNTVHIDPWFIQSDLPTQLSQVTVSLPTMGYVDHRILAYTDVEVTKKNNHKIFTAWEVPAFRSEPFMSSVRDNLQRIQFSYMPFLGRYAIAYLTMNKWDVISAALYHHPYLGGQAWTYLPGTESFIDSVSKFTSDTAKINCVYRYVKSKISWDQRTSFYAGNIYDNWENKSGNSAEINLIILNLLRKTGIKSYPLMVSTRNNGLADQKYETIGQFNSVDVIAMDETEQHYILDGSAKHLSYQLPPLNVVNTNALIIDSAKGKWVNIKDNRLLRKTMLFVVADVTDDGILKGKASFTYYDLAKQEKLSEKDEDDKTDYLQKDFSEARIFKLTEENKPLDDEPYNQQFEFSAQLARTDNFFFLEPFAFMDIRKNPFTDSVRTTDIDFGSSQLISSGITFNLPSGFSIETLPRNRSIRTADNSIAFTRQLSLEGSALRFEYRFQFNKAYFSKEDYPAIRQFFEMVYSIYAEKLLIKKD
jgi:hypothetical protein